MKNEEILSITNFKGKQVDEYKVNPQQLADNLIALALSLDGADTVEININTTAGRIISEITFRAVREGGEE